MTTPTDAQIEAAAKAICNDKHYPDQEAWDHMPNDIRDIYRQTAKAALTAAAEVGKSPYLWPALSWDHDEQKDQ